MDLRKGEKKDRLEKLLDRGVAMVHLDARVPGVAVPRQFADDFQLRLNFSRRFDPFDLTLSDWGVRQTLSFNRAPFSVAIPWQAIFALTSASGEGEVWLFPEALPPEVLEAAAKRWGLSEDEIAQLRQGARESPAIEVGPEVDDAAPIAELRGGKFVPRFVADEPAAAPAEPTPAPAEPADDAPEATPEPPAPPTGPRRGHLRVVK